MVRAPALAILGSAVLMAACKPVTTSAASDSATPTSLASASYVAEAPHHWSSRDGQEYGYLSALSDDDKKAGKAAADVLMFRYLGEKEGVYTVAGVHDGGITTASCNDPCEVVKLVTTFAGQQSTQHIAFNPNSLVGAALDDAMSGQMDVYVARAHRARKHAGGVAEPTDCSSHTDGGITFTGCK